jgi:tRNA(Ile)-lysidine synthase
MPAVIDRVRQFVRKHDLIRSETRVVAAVSGGSDSVALAHLAAELARRGELRLVGLVHFNHQLRATADADELFVRGLADTLGRPIVTDREDVGARARRERRSLEDAARVARHAGFERARVELEADVIALGHTRDDQAETFLLRLLRGAGPRGLASMYPRNGLVVRPLLDCRRDDLRAWLGERGIEYVEDETNLDVGIPRNRVRAELMPLLAARFNRRIVDVLADEAEIAREIWSWLEDEAGAFGSDLDVETLKRAHPALRRLVLWRAMRAAAGGRPVSFDHVRAALRLVESSEGSIDAPGHIVQRIGRRIVLRDRGLANRAIRANFFSYPLSIPGRVVVAEAGCVVSAELVRGGPEFAVTVDVPGIGDTESSETGATVGTDAAMGTGATVGIDATQGTRPPPEARLLGAREFVATVRGDLVQGTLTVRNRRAGDRFRPIGLNGSKKLQDLFVDRKLARHERDGVPVVVDVQDRIVWVAGFGCDEAFRVTDAAQAVLILRLTPVLGGSA